VVGLLPGSETPDEASSTWRTGTTWASTTARPGDNIYNGAVDNATGVAGIMEIAEGRWRRSGRTQGSG
jgi:hypothetical protein